MMTAAAHLEIVADPTESLAEVDRTLSELVEIQRETAVLEKRARTLRTNVKAFLVSKQLRSFQGRNGRKATLLSVCRYEFNRALAEKILDSETLGTLISPNTTTQLRVT